MEDLMDVHHLFDLALSADDLHTDTVESMQERKEWLAWTVLNYKQLAMLNQPPYGDRAIILESAKRLIGSCGFVPCLNAFEQMPNFDYAQSTGKKGLNTAEFGLFYAISPSEQRRRYATEAAQALVDYAFQGLNLKQIIATTDYENIGSIKVMEKLGMKIAQNPIAEPAWLQVVGVLENRE
jgi:ribosomal-protein-alanine N-acetyltransferase